MFSNLEQEAKDVCNNICDVVHNASYIINGKDEAIFQIETDLTETLKIKLSSQGFELLQKINNNKSAILQNVPLYESIDAILSENSEIYKKNFEKQLTKQLLGLNNQTENLN
ncbi:gsk3b-interacting protein [Anaeramoeba flamelloides]|uniref:Gsk3b-interacting protein n=1 Tax=Anaeramoeba flamelloides TaxID=1746091 RepID=A0AAV7Z548_9EUKA|nr:gsk3b-interacting protein [Anaeramoeba flamelloides]KAJ6244894.1 gsk3b-interacting protein [Anaeramoeba flamelloides]